MAEEIAVTTVVWVLLIICAVKIAKLKAQLAEVRELLNQHRNNEGGAARGEMLVVAHYGTGWWVVRTAPNEALETVSGPHEDHADAVQSAETRAYRIRQGWKP